MSVVAAAAVVATKKTDRVLEAIDQLRRRKARPDSQRICNYLFRRFSVSTAEAKADLEWCVDNHVVLKVEYKGNISYRNASKRQSALAGGGGHQPARSIMEQLSESEQLRLKQYRQQQKERKAAAAAVATQQHQQMSVVGSSEPPSHVISDKVNRKFGQLLTNAFGELVVSEPDYLEFGVPADEIIGNILAKDSVRYTKKYISILIEKEVESGGLIQMEGGKYLMGPNNVEQPQQMTMMERKTSSASDDNAIGGGHNDGDDDSSDVNNSIHRKYYIHVKPKKKPGPKPGGMKLSTSSSASIKENAENDEKKMENGNLRVGGRRKRAKKVFDPSDTHIPKKRGRPAGSLNKSTIEKQLAKMGDEPHNRPGSSTSNCSSRDHQQSGGVCSICHNKKASNERMVSCRECMVSAHANCLNGDDMMLRTYPDSTWQCPQCKTCVICYETSDAGNLVVCSVCADGYHANCLQPKVKITAKWLCINCEMPEELKINEIQSNLTNSLSHSKNSTLNNDTEQVSSSPSISGNSSPNYQSPPLSPTPPRLSPQNEIMHKDVDAGGGSDSQSFKEENDEDDIDPTIPDASNWTAEEVYQYFAQYFPREASIFREQEIDGRSLLLLTRLDVLTNLKLKLGPALKIYKHVVKLQVRRDDPKLYWL